MGATFASNTAEFLPAGVLTEMSHDLNVSEAQVGLLVSTFALTVAVSTLPLTYLTRRMPRKALLVVLVAGLALSNLATAVAPSYEFLVVARVLAGLCHGLFWSVATPYASYLVDRSQLTRALTVVNAGTSLGFIVGVPLGTAIGLALGWRAAFTGAGLLLALCAVLSLVVLPHIDHHGVEHADDSEAPVHPLRDKSLIHVLWVAGIVLLAALGQYSFYTYISPWLLGPGGVPSSGLSLTLFVFGVAGAIGLVVTGVLADRNMTAAMIAVLAATAVTAALLGLLAHEQVSTVILVALWGFAFAGFPSLVHTIALRTSSRQIHTFAGAIVSVSFNTAIALGAAVGGIVIDSIGPVGLPWTQVVLTLAAILVALVALPRVLPARPRSASASNRPTAE